MGVPVDIDFFNPDRGVEFSPYASKRLGGLYWVLKKAFVYNMDESGDKRIIVPMGYLTDGASVPKSFQFIIPPWGDYGQAVIIHDWLCEYLGYWDKDKWVSIDRRECDSIFNEVMKRLRVKPTIRLTIYYAVSTYRLFIPNDTRTFDKLKNEVELELVDNYFSTGAWQK